MKRLLFITPSHNRWGGLEKLVHELSDWLPRHSNWEVRVALPRGLRFHDPVAYLSAHPHLKVEAMDVRVGTESARRSAIVRAIDRLEPDIVVPLLSGSAFPAIAESKVRGSGVRFLVSINLLQPGLFVNTEEVFGSVDGLILWHRLFYRYWIERFPEERDRIHVISQGVRHPERLRQPSSPSRPLRCAYVGRVEVPHKRILDLVPFMRESVRLGTPMEMHVYGDGPALQDLRTVIDREGLPVAFHGHRTHAELYREVWPDLDVVLLFSGHEGATPFALCEAMAHGVVPVTTAFPGLEADGVVADGRSALTFPVGRPEAAAARVQELATDRSLLETLSRGAADAMAGRTDESMHAAFLQVLDRTMELPAKLPRSFERSRPAGRLERLVSTRVADRLRQWMGRYFRHEFPGGEWPSELPHDEAKAAEVVEELMRLDADEKRRASAER